MAGESVNEQNVVLHAHSFQAIDTCLVSADIVVNEVRPEPMEKAHDAAQPHDRGDILYSA